MRRIHGYGKTFLIVLIASLAISPSLTLAGEPPGLAKALEAQKRHTEVLMNLPGVVGTAVGWSNGGQPIVKIYTEKIGIGGLPKNLNGVPVVLEVTGRIQALPAPPCKGPNANDPECQNSGGGESSDPTNKFQTPVPIGVSAGNMESIQQVGFLINCSTGTLGTRVKDGSGNVFALSNNHVFALSNAATLNSQMVQPGPADADSVCSQDLSYYNPIGYLEAFAPIDFTGGTNTIDAAIARVDINTVGNSTPSDGYGIPQNTLMTCNSDCSNLSNLKVQKYGRTTGLTKGTITGINVMISVNYNAGTAIFTDQIEVSANGKKGGFIKSGDSGSLLVTDSGNQPVGLLFAGDSRGKFGFANRIDFVLNHFQVMMDGE